MIFFSVESQLKFTAKTKSPFVLPSQFIMINTRDREPKPTLMKNKLMVPMVDVFNHTYISVAYTVRKLFMIFIQYMCACIISRRFVEFNNRVVSAVGHVS